MHIIWKGQTCFNLLVSQNKGEQISITIDPYDTTTETKIAKSKSDIIISSQRAKIDDLLTGSETTETVHVLNEPGEYDIKDIFIKGIYCANKGEDKEIAGNTIFTIEAEGMHICHLGLAPSKELTSAQFEEIGDVDILLVPVGDHIAVDGNDAASLVNRIEPKIVIPMYYKTSGMGQKLDGVEKFLKAVGETSPEIMEKLLIKSKDLPDENTKVIVLKP